MFDLARKQLARSIDVMLEANPTLPAPLSLRKPERTFLVLLTPALTQPGRAEEAISKSRLYGLAHAGLQGPEQLPATPAPTHRDSHQVTESAERLGRASWEDCHAVVPGACPWLTASHGAG